jgi:hypothetical protein
VGQSTRFYRSSPRRKIIFDIVGALAEYPSIACDLIESDQQHKPSLPFGDSTMNTASTYTLFNTTARAAQGHNGNNWITAVAD